MEDWRTIDWIAGYKGTLEVSTFGRVRRSGYRYKTKGRWGTVHSSRKPDKVLSTEIGTHGYATLAIYIDGKRNRFLVHRLVAQAFVQGYAHGLSVNHINGCKIDNRPENLEWVTLAQNTQMQWEDGLVNLRGNNNPNRKLHSGHVRILRRLLAKGASATELAALSGMSVSSIYKIGQGARWASIT